MREAMNFIFNEISSEDMGVVIASPNGGLFEEDFLPKRTIVETKIPYRDNPYHQRVDLEPLSFSLTIFISEWKERDNLRQIAKWLYQPYYKPLIFSTNLNRIYYALFEGDSKLVHNGAKEGYITLNVRCSSPYTYSKVETTDMVSSRVVSPVEDVIYNSGDIDVQPKMWIKKTLSTGNVQIENLTNGQIVKINGVQNGEEVFIDFDREEIISSLEYLTVYRHDDHNNVWLTLESEFDGENRLKFTGDFDVHFSYEMKYLMEWGD